MHVSGDNAYYARTLASEALLCSYESSKAKNKPKQGQQQQRAFYHHSLVHLQQQQHEHQQQQHMHGSLSNALVRRGSARTSSVALVQAGLREGVQRVRILGEKGLLTHFALNGYTL